ncbi:MAG: hypothetical protein J6J93_04750 [Muribaculaceae bacterium]|nr:hypothetical protein [Muribaculaceae bacterium]
MKKAIYTLILAILSVCCVIPAEAQIVRKSTRHLDADSIEHVVVDGDTMSIILPEQNFGRFDRGLFNYLYIPRGKWSFGLTASYGELQTEDVQVLSMLKDVDFDGRLFSIKPFISYFIHNNQSIGLRFNYTRGTADLGKLGVDFSDDLSFTLRDVSYFQETLSVSTFYRNYIGLDNSGIFGIFNEVDLSFGAGSSRFKRLYNNEPKDTRTIITQGALNFSPGVCVFIQDCVAFNVSFGVFGLKWKKEQQTTDGIDEGTRVTSGANFRFNIFNINFGLMVVI